MTLIKEYRFTTNCTLEEYKIAQLYSVAEASKAETGGGEGVEVLKNEPYVDEAGNKGQYTHKIYHLSSKVPGWVRALAPAGALILEEKAWNAYPYCKTVVTNGYMKENFELVTETMHVADDRGNLENAVRAPPEVLKKREVVIMDAAKDKLDKNDYNAEQDPTLFKSQKTGRGPLTGDWMKTCEPVMTAYKLVTVKFQWFGLQGRVESFIHGIMKNLLLKFHKQLFCLMDQWYGLTIEDIRNIEEQTKAELDRKRKEEGISGTSLA
ncbi:Phosphotidylinositol transfer protein, beta [Basidiobolus meristosporus CBS 931.73]|uniref:Phosphotidylinositol transfer protein, beta n=1 Tax=Basidiobolus meristosporus CBS 931.73 TaxID=1314790 RepID=A0A1Y1YL39_9FUNG|nr:Phosphotidylinositol transfer protein, beta [Basidiobolus meristosporus CBS 931.73]|eukprot:ORX98708.1 Phosphotidylinositol transfer protein, beta [Basidiobolus meristosporus CBS 931.73]